MRLSCPVIAMNCAMPGSSSVTAASDDCICCEEDTEAGARDGAEAGAAPKKPPAADEPLPFVSEAALFWFSCSSDPAAP